MVRAKKTQSDTTRVTTRGITTTRRSGRKRGREDENEAEAEAESDDVAQGTPPKRRNTRTISGGRSKQVSKMNVPTTSHPSDYDFPSDEDEDDPTEKRTPGGRSKVLTSIAANSNGEVSTPRNRKGKGKVVQITSNPTTPSGTRNTPAGETPQWRRYDRSARKKSARALIEKVIAGDPSDDDDGDQEDVAREIYESEEDEDEDEDEDEQDEDGVDSDARDRDVEEGEEQIEAATPSRSKRGRPRKQKTATIATRKRKRSPTPPRDLPPHELYFAQNRPGQANKTSNNTLASLRLLTHDEYFAVLQQGSYVNPHAEDIAFLQAVHAESFPQWAFELSQGFSVCLYGYGSKRRLLHRFASYLYEKTRPSSPSPSPHHKIVIVNGYVRTSSLREILGTVAAAVDRTHRLPAGSAFAMLDSLAALLASRPGARVTVVLNSVDAAPLRRAGVQAALARLAAQPGVRLVCSADTPDFALLWDSALRSRFNFAFHDCTTFEPLAGAGAAEADAVDDVHELLGRRARRVGGKEGVSYVLRSLPENAKNLFRLLVGEVLAAMDDDDAGGGDAGENPGIEYRMLYNKAVEEFICSSEMAFRTLLKEFHDHQMIISRKDVLGTELLSVPFRKEELEAILEELMS